MTRVVIVGAGPAGSAAAITGARLGLDVTLVDKCTFPRDKTCGDGLTAGTLRILEHLGLEPARVGSFTPVRETVLVSPSGRSVVLPLPRDGLFAAVARRADLDASLVELAGKAGAEVIEGDAVTAVERGDGSGTPAVALTLASERRLRAEYVVAADGMYSAVRKLIDPGHDAYLGEMHAFRQYFTGVHDERLHVIFDADVLPGYAWVFPLGGGRANVGYGIHRRDGASVQHMKHQWRELLTRPAFQAVLRDAQPEAPHRAWPIPADLGRAALAAGPVLFAGDAAGATDPLTGEGIGQALLTGMHAVQSIVAAGAGGQDAVAERYRDVVERDLGRDLRFARSLLTVLREPRRARVAIRAAGWNDWTRRNFARWMFEDYPRALVLTPSRWRRGAMHGPGAYRGEEFGAPRRIRDASGRRGS